jgi:hypothetical protein
MNEMQWTFIDRTEWPVGEWDREPDKMQWVDEATGLPCLIHRGRFGAWCGYVGVSETHPVYECDHEAVDIAVHGGLTFSSHCDPQHDEATGRGICHVPAPGEPDNVWWLGFDCAHCFDFSPGIPKLVADVRGDSGLSETYRNMAYAREQTRLLAQQLADMQ